MKITILNYKILLSLKNCLNIIRYIYFLLPKNNCSVYQIDFTTLIYRKECGNLTYLTHLPPNLGWRIRLLSHKITIKHIKHFTITKYTLIHQHTHIYQQDNWVFYALFEENAHAKPASRLRLKYNACATVEILSLKKILYYPLIII